MHTLPKIGNKIMTGNAIRQSRHAEELRALGMKKLTILILDGGTMLSSKKRKDVTLESVLWKAANKFRSSMDPSESMLVVLGLIFLKYVSDQENGTTIKAREGRSCAY